MSEQVDVVVIGSGAGGGVIAGELGKRGRRVVLLEMGIHRTARDFQRFEHEAFEHMWQPMRFAETGPDTPPIAMGGGRCVGGSTTINTKVGIRATEENIDRWYPSTGLVNELGEPFTLADLHPYYARIEDVLGVRLRTDFNRSVLTVARGFNKLGHQLEGTPSYTDYNCSQCGSCTSGCPTNSGKSTLTQWIQPGWLRGEIDLRPGCEATRVVIEDVDGDLRATGVEYIDATGKAQRVDARVVVVCGGTLLTPLLLQRSGIVELSGGSPSSRQIGRNMGTHTARIVHGRFPEPQDAHLVYPIMARCDDYIREADGGFVIEATTTLDPAALAHNLIDEQGLPLWGQRLVDVMKDYRHWVGLFMQVKDSNGGTVTAGPDGSEHFTKPLTQSDLERLDRAHGVCVEVLEAAGATDVLSTGFITAHMQGSCRMGADPERSAIDSNQESHDVRGLFVGDSSVIPSTMSVGPSLTVMSLALRLAEHIDTDAAGYLAARQRIAT